MALDARIPLMAQGLNLEPRQNALMRVQQMAGAQQQNALRAMQMQQLQQAMAAEAEQRKAQEAQRAQLAQALQAIPSPRLAPLGGNAAPTPANAAKMGNDPRLEALYRLMQAGQVKPTDYLSEAYPEQKETIVPAGATVRKGGQAVFTAPVKPPEDPEILRVATLLQSMPPNDPRRAIVEAWLKKQTTHAPAAQAISYGSPVPIMLPDGSVGYAQPGNRQGAQPQIMSGPGGTPLVKPSETKDKDLTEAQAKATALLGQMRSATDALTKVGADQTVLSTQAETALAGGPMNIAVREKAQRIRQAQDQWSEAFLRFKTGAATTKDEVAANRKTFFPVLGDKPEQVMQKLEARKQAERDMEIVAGRGGAKLNARDAAPDPQKPQVVDFWSLK